MATLFCFCCACGRVINPGDVTAYRADLAPARTVHAWCAGAAIPAGVLARFRQAYALRPEDARRLAMSLGEQVTRSKKYRPHAEVCYQASRARATDEAWARFVAAGGAPAPAPAPAPAAHHPIVDAGTAPAAAVAATVDEEALATAVAAAVTEAVGDLDERVEATARAVAAEAASAAAKAAVLALAPRRVEVKVADRPPVQVGRTHKQFDKLLQMVSAGVHVWLCGPAGSGKTTAAEQVAKGLGLRFYFNGAVDSEYKLSGFVDAQGRIVSTAFRKAYKDGGLYLFDEVDASMAGALLAFNAALANGHADFPGEDAPVACHPDFRCLAAANTWGHGATSEYVGRAKLDAAFLDRFVQLTWDYDEGLERELAKEALGDRGAAWARQVQGVRAKGRERGLKVVVSPRATIFGCRLMAAGASEEEALEATIAAKLTAQDRTNLGLPALRN